MAAWILLKENRLRLTLKVAPGAKCNKVTAPKVGAKERAFLKVSVTSAPEGGKANAAVIKFLAKRWKVAARHFSLTSGATARQKVIEIADGDQALLQGSLMIEETETQSRVRGG